jgi:succinylglutamic semialdehyde dehydrogenase
MIKATGNYIAGEFSLPETKTGRIVSTNPFSPDKEIWAQEVSVDDAGRAVEAASGAWRAWRKRSLDERATYLQRLKEEISAHGDALAMAITEEAGKALWEAKTEIAALQGKIEVTLGEARKEIEPQRLDATSRISHHPHGVMAVLGPFNFPLSLSHGHVVPALLAGNTVVLKPSELVPGVAQLYAECVHRAGFPSGVFNLVQGGGDVGATLASHRDVRGVLFTGSYAVGRALQQGALDQPQKILALEMGGKNASIVFPDADERLTLYETLFSAFVTTGQRCTATSRLIVVDDGQGSFDAFTRAFTQVASQLTAGDPKANATFMGPLISARALEKFEHATRNLSAAGETLLAPRRAGPGYLTTPHIVRAPAEAGEVFREEIFGPSVTIYRAKDEAHALKLAGDTPYGLALSVFTSDKECFERCLEESRAGIVNWNKGTVGATGRLPFGGVGASGNFRPAGSYSLRYCTYPTATVIGESAPKDLPPGFALQ